MKKYVLIAFYCVMTYFGIIRLFYWLNRHKEIVLAYHNVIPDELFDQSYHLGISHSQSIFEQQIQFLRKRRSGRYLITFDDGYKNQLEIAAKILNRYGLQGVFFVSFQSVTSGQTLTIDKVMMWISYAPVGTYALFGKPIHIEEETRNLVASHLYHKLIKDHSLWATIEEELDKAFSFKLLPIDPKLARLRFEPMTTQDLIALTKQGHFLGAHGWSHQPLGTLPLEMQKEDFIRSAQSARQHCNSMLYSYPFGGTEEVSPLTTRLCAEYGFTAAYMNIPQSPKWKEVDGNYVLPRFCLPNESNPYLLDAKLSGFEEFFKKIVGHA